MSIIFISKSKWQRNIVQRCARVGWSQTFKNHCFYGIFTPFLPKISGKFKVKSQIYEIEGVSGCVSQIWVNCPELSYFFRWLPYKQWSVNILICHSDLIPTLAWQKKTKVICNTRPIQSLHPQQIWHSGPVCSFRAEAEKPCLNSREGLHVRLRSFQQFVFSKWKSFCSIFTLQNVKIK